MFLEMKKNMSVTMVKYQPLHEKSSRLHSICISDKIRSSVSQGGDGYFAQILRKCQMGVTIRSVRSTVVIAPSNFERRAIARG
jgi:hypothetical protein